MDPNSQSPTPVPVAPASDPYYSDQGGSSPIKKILLIVVGLIILVGFIVGGIFLVKMLTQNQKPKDVTLTYWGLWDDANIMAPVIADFERAYPHTKIQYEKQDIKGLKDYGQRLATRITDGTGPDIVRFHSSWALQLRKYLKPFPQRVVSDIQLEKDYYKTVQYDMKVDGAYYGVPLGIDTLAMYVNTKMLSEKGLPIPTDWNDIYVKYAPDLVVKNENGEITTPSISLGTFDNISHSSDIIALLLLQNGADLTDLDGVSKNSAESALEYYTAFAQGEEAVWDETMDNSTLAFAKGNLPLYFGYSWDLFSIKAINQNLEFEVVKVPTLVNRSNTVASYWAEGVTSKSKNSKEAFEFLTFMSKPETLQKLHQTQAKVRLFGTLYPRKSMAPLLSSNKLVYPFISQADNAQSTFFSSDTYDGKDGMITQMNVYLGDAVRSMNKNTSASTAVGTLAKGVKQVLSHN